MDLKKLLKDIWNYHKKQAILKYDPVYKEIYNINGSNVIWNQRRR